MNPKRQRRLVDCGEVPFPLPTNRKPSTETGTAHIICHPELAKDLTAGQSALGHHSPFSKLTAPSGELSVLITGRLKRTSRSPREIPSTDSGQALRRLPMNLPERRGVRERESGEHPRLACWRRRPADADFLRCRRDQQRRCLWRGAKGRTRGRVRSPEPGLRRSRKNRRAK